MLSCHLPVKRSFLFLFAVEIAELVPETGTMPLRATRRDMIEKSLTARPDVIAYERHVGPIR